MLPGAERCRTAKASPKTPDDPEANMACCDLLMISELTQAIQILKIYITLYPILSGHSLHFEFKLRQFQGCRK